MPDQNGRLRRNLNVVLFGPPGSGKGTQAQNLVKQHGFTHLSTGDILRQEIASQTPLGKKAERYMKHGLLVPDLEVGMMVKKKLQELKSQGASVLFDGYPRTYPQAEQVDLIFHQLDMTLHGIIALTLDPELLISRITARRSCSKCKAIYNLLVDALDERGDCPACHSPLIQRDDDNEEVVRKRIDGYRHETAPLLNHYSRQGILYPVDGLGTVHEVAQRVAAVLEQIERESTEREKPTWEDKENI